MAESPIAASQGTALGENRVAMSSDSTVPQEDPGDISRAELFPFFHSLGELRRRAFLWPGVLTITFSVALLLFAAVDNEVFFFWCLGLFISIVNVYILYLCCGKKNTISISYINFNPFLWIIFGALIDYHCDRGTVNIASVNRSMLSL
jgi:hypothetical protein